MGSEMCIRDRYLILDSRGRLVSRGIVDSSEQITIRDQLEMGMYYFRGIASNERSSVIRFVVNK